MMKSNKKHICCNIDDNYARHCGVMLCSLFENNKQEQFEIHILISSLSLENKKKLEDLVNEYDSVCHFHTVDSEVLKGVKYREDRPLSEATYYRILLPSTLDNSISKILYLDADMIVLGSISPLFSIDLKGYALAATKDLCQLNDELRFGMSIPVESPYFNAGMMLINLDYWRENDSEKELIEFSKKDWNVFNHDQDALNAVFRGKWFRLSQRWNRFFPYNYDDSFFENEKDRNEFEHHPVIIHYLDYFKAWNKFTWIGYKWHKYRKAYYSYLKLTPWGSAKPVKLHLQHFKKFTLYHFLALYSIHGLFIQLKNLLFHKTLKLIDRIFSMPFLILLKIYYKVETVSHHIHRRIEENSDPTIKTLH